MNDNTIQHRWHNTEAQGLVFEFGLTPEDWENIKQLKVSAGWRTYEKLLMAMKNGYQASMYPMKDPNEVMKQLGIVVGLNLSVNQLSALLAQYKLKTERLVAEEAKNQP